MLSNLFQFQQTKYRTFIKLFNIKIHLKNKVDRSNFDIKEYIEENYKDKYIDQSFYDNLILNFSDFGLNNQYRDKKVIVSLTSFPERISELKYTIFSLLNQSFKPDKILLWLSYDEFPGLESDLPQELLNFKSNGLEIRFCQNLKSYKKLIFSLKEFPDDIIVTADDDIFYDYNWLKLLYESYLQDKLSISCHSAKEIRSFWGFILPYETWKKQDPFSGPQFKNIQLGFGGVLYPPHSLHPSVFDIDLFQNLSPYGDDIWFWAMALLNNTKIKVVQNYIKYPLYVNIFRELGLNNQITLFRTFNKTNGNDKQMKKIVKYFNLGKKLYD